VVVLLRLSEGIINDRISLPSGAARRDCARAHHARPLRRFAEIGERPFISNLVHSLAPPISHTHVGPNRNLTQVVSKEIGNRPFYGTVTRPGPRKQSGVLTVDKTLRVVDVFGKSIEVLYD